MLDSVFAQRGEHLLGSLTHASDLQAWQWMYCFAHCALFAHTQLESSHIQLRLKFSVIAEQACLDLHSFIASQLNALHCTREIRRLAVRHAEKDEEGSKLLEAVNVVTAKTGTTVALSE